jgi:hypothetical protein
MIVAPSRDIVDATHVENQIGSLDLGGIPGTSEIERIQGLP